MNPHCSSLKCIYKYPDKNVVGIKNVYSKYPGNNVVGIKKVYINILTKYGENKKY